MSCCSTILASISPQIQGPGAPTDAVYSNFVRANSPEWTSDLGPRLAYARQALTVQTLRDRYDDPGTEIDFEIAGIGPSVGGDFAAWIASLPPLIPVPEHALQPARQFPDGDTTRGPTRP